MIGVRTNEAKLADDLLACLPPGWVPIATPFVEHLLSVRLAGPSRPGSRSFNIVHSGVGQVARTLNRAEALDALENTIHHDIATRSPHHVFLHAGVIGWRGRAIVFPGRSCAGKTTLVKELIAAGATYFSDEYAVLDASGMVHPFPRRLSVRQPDGQTVRVSAHELGATIGIAPLPIGQIICTEFISGSTWRPRPLSPSRAVIELAGCMLPEATHSTTGREALERVACSAQVWKGPRGQAIDMVNQLLGA